MLICLDVGGTVIKAAAVEQGGAVTGGITSYPAMADLDKEPLLDHIAEIIEKTAEGRAAEGLRFAFPGPFDYEKGISLMRGLQKYDSLYGVPLREALSERLARLNLHPWCEAPPEQDRTVSPISTSSISAAGRPNSETAHRPAMLFTNDVTAFALGHLNFGRVADSEKAMFVCVGTGCGSAFSEKRSIVTNEQVACLPEHGYIYNTPFLDSIIDDYISRRGIMELSEKMLGYRLDGKKLAARAEQDEKALACFLVFGKRLCAALEPYISSYMPDTLVLGGGIMKSAGLFISPLRVLCSEKSCRLFIDENTSYFAIRGLSVLR